MLEWVFNPGAFKLCNKAGGRVGVGGIENVDADAE